MKRLILAALMISTALFAATAQAQRANPELLLARQVAADQGLFFALAKGDVTSMAILRDQGANPNVSLAILGLRVKDVFGAEQPILKQPFDPVSWPMLHWAVYLGDIDAVKLLVRAGARVNTPDVYGATALHWAAWSGNHSIAKVLLNNGANCRSVDLKKRTAKDWAIMVGQNDMIRLLDSRTCRSGPIRDADQDGVPDDQDMCPNTPFGAPVDERGCWVVAYANFFDFDKAVVKSQYLPYLASAATVLKNHPDLLVDVEGHTDAVGSDSYNLKLGLRRAEAVKRVLISHGVAASRLNVTSYGESRPIADNSSTSGRARNRRVEINVAQPGAVMGGAPSRVPAPAGDEAPAAGTISPAPGGYVAPSAGAISYREDDALSMTTVAEPQSLREQSGVAAPAADVEAGVPGPAPALGSGGITFVEDRSMSMDGPSGN